MAGRGFPIAVFQREQVSLEKTGQSCTVPNDYRARLMYYLSCIGSLLDMRNNETQRKYQDYQNYSRIQSLSDKKTLLYLCAVFSPDELDDQCIFHSEKIDSDNEFFEIKQVENTFGVSDSVLIGGQRTRVAKVMVYKMSWMRRNFLEPIMALRREC